MTVTQRQPLTMQQQAHAGLLAMRIADRLENRPNDAWRDVVLAERSLPGFGDDILATARVLVCQRAERRRVRRPSLWRRVFGGGA